MKKCQFLMYSLFIWLGISLIACEDNSIVNDSSSDIYTFESEEGAAFGHNNGTVATPFKADFTTVLNVDESGFNADECPEPPFTFFNVQEGSGEATHLGKFSIRFTFCIDLTALFDDGVLTGEESTPFINSSGTFTAANGDELFFTAASGAAFPSDKPDYSFEVHDPFTFIGGTGRFEGASGEGMMNSFGAQLTTDHIWTGEIILSPDN